MIKQFYLMAAAAAVSAHVFAGANLIQNGTFEGSAAQHKWGGYWDSKGFSCPGWKFEGLSGIAKSDGVWVAEKFSVGRYAMFLQPWKDAAVSQVIPVLPSGDYRLSFNYVARPNHPGNTQIWLGTKKLGEVESDATMRHFSTNFSLSKKQENVLFKFFSPARDAEKDIAIENVVLQRLDASIGDAKYPDLLTAMIHAADGETIVYSPAGGDAELKDGAALARRATDRVRSLKEEDGKLILVVGAAAQGKTVSADVGLLPAEIGLGWENGWVKEWVRDVPAPLARQRRNEVPRRVPRQLGGALDDGHPHEGRLRIHAHGRRLVASEGNNCSCLWWPVFGKIFAC